MAHQNGQHISFDESTRVDGRAASAKQDEFGKMSTTTSGTSPQGEEQTLSVCRSLIKKLNLRGYNWKEPSLCQNTNNDCKCFDKNYASLALHIQIVRTDVNPKIWKELNTSGSVAQDSIEVADLVERIKIAIKKKAEIIPQYDRRTLTLALDATLLPAFGFKVVIQDFNVKYEKWAHNLGFQSIWLVGPDTSLTAQLDAPS